MLQPNRASLVSSGTEPAPTAQEPTQKTEFNEEDLSFLDAPKVEPTQNDPTTDEGFTAFGEQFKKYTGVDFKQAVDMLSELQQTKQQQVVQQQVTNLQNTWGVDSAETDRRLALIRQRFQKYPPQLQAQLDNEEGARLIWAKLQMESQTQVPQLDRASNRTATASSKWMYTQSQITGMDNDTYRKEADRISYAYQNGLVNKDA